MDFALLQSRIFTIWLGIYGMLLLKRAVGMVVLGWQGLSIGAIGPVVLS